MNATHEVQNQSTPLAGHNVYSTDRALRDALQFNAPGADEAQRVALGALLGDAAMQTHARLANVHKPELHTHDPFGRRIDTVEFHPSYHALIGAAIGAGLHATPWAPAPDAHIEREGARIDVHLEREGPRGGAHIEREGPRGGAHVEREGPRGGAHVERAAGFMMFTQLEPSVLCPVSMTYAVAPALRGNGAVFADWFDKLASTRYDPRLAFVGDKRGATMGMGMTEKQGGSDVRANTTRAEYLEDTAWGRCYRLTGHKWFFSAPMSDAFLVLAQTAVGLSCFFLPRVLPDGTLNGIAIQRLKDKLGNQANASSEVEFNGALAWLVGEEGRGIPQILEMGTLTRLDCALGTAGLMRGAVALALHHCAQRTAFGKPLIDQVLMTNVLADLAVESEAATALALRLARAIDKQDDPFEGLMRRVLTPVAKFWVCKRGAMLAQEAMECLGGNGYVEEHGAGVMARIYREMPLNSIWEGAGNIMALDLLRAFRKGDVASALATELAPARGQHAALDRLIQALPQWLEEDNHEIEARRLARDVAIAVQAALLCQHAPPAVFAAFCDSRLAGHGVFGALHHRHDLDTIVQRAMPT